MLNTPTRLDGRSSAAFEEDLVGRISGGATDIVLDCAALTYISSAGLRALLIGAKRMMEVDGRIVLCGVHDHCREALEVSGFIRFFQLLPSLEAAGVQPARDSLSATPPVAPEPQHPEGPYSAAPDR